MGGFGRKYVSRRLLALIEGEIAAAMTAMRQVGVCSQGGADALTIFHQLVFDEWASGSLNAPAVRITVDEKRTVPRFSTHNEADMERLRGEHRSRMHQL